MIYFIQAGDTGSIKIGTCREDQIKARLGALQIGNANEFQVLGIMDGDWRKEGELHRLFRTHRQRGEWFAPAAEIIDHVRANGKEFQLKRKVPSSPVETAILALGGPTRAAKILGVSQPNISMWKIRKRVPADKVLAVEAVTGISRHVLREDIFGPVPTRKARA